MNDEQKQNTAWAKFLAFKANPPAIWDERTVSEHHQMIADLEEAFPGHDLSAFRIPDSRLERQVVGARRAPRSGRPMRGLVQWSSERYCDVDYALRQIDGIVRYFENLNPPSEPPKFGFSR
jgi:hypothetical protein